MESLGNYLELLGTCRGGTKDRIDWLLHEGFLVFGRTLAQEQINSLCAPSRIKHSRHVNQALTSSVSVASRLATSPVLSPWP